MCWLRAVLTTNGDDGQDRGQDVVRARETYKALRAAGSEARDFRAALRQRHDCSSEIRADDEVLALVETSKLRSEL